jgi:hypothetical protein
MTSQPQYQPPPYRDQVARSAGIAIALIIAAGCGVYWLHSRGDIGPAPTCAQQYAGWKNGSADAAKAQADARALSAAGNSEDIADMVAALEAIGGDAASLQADPMPACADPAGYWPQVLSELKAAGDNAGTTSGLGALLLAAAPLKQLPATQAKLSAELARTAGVRAPITVPSAAATPDLLPTLPTVAPAAVPSASPLPTLATVAPGPVPTAPAPTLATLAPAPTMAS